MIGPDEDRQTAPGSAELWVLAHGHVARIVSRYCWYFRTLSSQATISNGVYTTCVGCPSYAPDTATRHCEKVMATQATNVPPPISGLFGVQMSRALQHS